MIELIGFLWEYPMNHPEILFLMGGITFMISFVLMERDRILKNEHRMLEDSIGPSAVIGMAGILLTMIWPIVLGLALVTGVCWGISRGLERYFLSKSRVIKVLESSDPYIIAAEKEVERVLEWKELSNG